ncbi:hypothetical protein [Bradyrhizobium guangzhouense]|uniref:Uncharacterized protein n=1 Tax=Bradyrhizobium guangzhouense TaxID=1325095 RepID=A0AAE6C6Y5_9BRAD|nr:hypothetical protein [Bradyrhizobium guangzhouense]QAU45098.1 hypothetical protein XH91_06865 [Bradyrhizobium guangzhouense]RXH16414.1 hypothetical protein EAS56_05270 [Bradyrhizobium guangzhouense]
MSIAASLPVARAQRNLAPLCVAAASFLLLLVSGDSLLHDPDTLWQIKVGQWILDHHAVPWTDFYSLTRQGEVWLSTSWLSQVLFATTYSHWGWAGPVILTAAAIALAMGLLLAFLQRHLDLPYALVFCLLAMTLAAPHLLARPHVLALPVMVAWSGALMTAADRGRAPSFLLLPLMVLWANLHGGFVLGLALVGAIGLEALWCAAPARRPALMLRWAAFGVGALAASCCTPYGVDTLLGAARILSLGKSFSVIAEWRPADFSAFNPFAGALLGLLGLALTRSLTLSPPRVLLILGTTWMALAHVRSIETFGVIVPLVLAQPLSGWFRSVPDASRGLRMAPGAPGALAAVAIMLAAASASAAFAARHSFAFSATQTPVAAVDVLAERKAARIFNSYGFGGYLIVRDIRPFVDGRSELYGEKFLMDYFAAEDGRDVAGLLRMLDENKIDATLLTADSPAAQMLDHVAGWKRIYTDKIAVVHVRDNQAAASK